MWNVILRYFIKKKVRGVSLRVMINFDNLIILGLNDGFVYF